MGIALMVSEQVKTSSLSMGCPKWRLSKAISMLNQTAARFDLALSYTVKKGLLFGDTISMRITGKRCNIDRFEGAVDKWVKNDLAQWDED